MEPAPDREALASRALLTCESRASHLRVARFSLASRALLPSFPLCREGGTHTAEYTIQGGGKLPSLPGQYKNTAGRGYSRASNFCPVPSGQAAVPRTSFVRHTGLRYTAKAPLPAGGISLARSRSPPLCVCIDESSESRHAPVANQRPRPRCPVRSGVE